MEGLAILLRSAGLHGQALEIEGNLEEKGSEPTNLGSEIASVHGQRSLQRLRREARDRVFEEVELREESSGTGGLVAGQNASNGTLQLLKQACIGEQCDGIELLVADGCKVCDMRERIEDVQAGVDALAMQEGLESGTGLGRTGSIDAVGPTRREPLAETAMQGDALRFVGGARFDLGEMREARSPIPIFGRELGQDSESTPSPTPRPRMARSRDARPSVSGRPGGVVSAASSFDAAPAVPPTSLGFRKKSRRHTVPTSGF